MSRMGEFLFLFSAGVVVATCWIALPILRRIADALERLAQTETKR